MSNQSLHVAFDGGSNLVVRSVDHAIPGHEHKIDTGQLGRLMTETLAGQALDAVALMGLGRHLARDGQAEARVTQIVRTPDERCHGIAGALWLSEYPLVVARREQPKPAWESLAPEAGLWRFLRR